MNPLRHTPIFELKAVSDAGEFEGYASIFGNVDHGGDVIQPGAFKEIVANHDGKVPVLWQHRQDSPIGVAEVSQDTTGLRFKGRLVLDDPQARQAYSHMKAGSVRGMSIGYDVLAGGAQILASGVRSLTGLKLWEISLVTFGMNPLAGVTGVKNAPDNIRDLEHALRGMGYSRKGAAAIASHGFSPAALDPSPDPDDVRALKAALDSINQAFTR